MKRFLPLLILTGLLFGQDVLTLNNWESYKGRYVKKVDELIVFQVEGENHFTPFPINDVAIIKTSNWGELTYPFNIPRKEFNNKWIVLLGCAIITVLLLSSISITSSGVGDLPCPAGGDCGSWSNPYQ